MRTIRIILIFPIIITLLFCSSCNSNSSLKVSEELEYALNSMYPNASYLEWNRIDGFYVGEFRNEGFYCKAWFDKHANWLMTETSDLIYDKNLPQMIRADFENRYTRRNVDDISRVEYANIETRFVIEVEERDDDIYLLYLNNGFLLKEVVGNWNNRPIIIPSRILNFLSQEEDIISIVDVEFTSYFIRIYDRNGKIICFNPAPYDWLATYWRISETEVQKNETVSAQVNSLLAHNETVTTVYKVHYVDITPYIYTFEINNGEKFYSIREDGETIEINNVLFKF